MSYETTRRHEENSSAYYYMKEANLKGHTFYNSNQMTLWKRQQNYGDSKNQQLEGGKEEQAEHRGFFRAVSTVYDTVMMDTFVQTHGGTPSESEQVTDFG